MSDLSVPLEALQRSRSQLSVSTYFDAEPVSARDGADLRARPALPRARAVRARDRRLPRPAAGTRRPRPGAHRQGVELISNVCRHRQAVMLRGRGHTGSNIVCPLHRWTYDTHGQLARRAAFRRRPLPEPAQLPGAELERPAVRGRRPRRRRRPGTPRPEGRPRLLRLRVRQRAPARVRLQLEDLHRGLPGGLPRRARSTRAWATSSPARTCAGSSARSTRCRRWAPTRRWPRPARPSTASGTTPCSPTATACRPSTARSG